MKRHLDLYAENPVLWQRVLAIVYGWAVRLRLSLYRLGLLKSRRLPVRVISVGNLVVGGTGKSPAVEMIAGLLVGQGRRVAVLSRGYRGSAEKYPAVVSDGERILLGPNQAGDEPVMMARRLPGVPVIVGPDRLSSGRYALDHFQADCLILDDGFQHLKLARDVNLLLLDAEKPWGNGWMVPAGPLREPMGQAKRATAFILTRSGSNASPASALLAESFPGRPVFHTRHRPVRLVSLDGKQTQGVEYLNGRRVLAFCGLARPETFGQTLEELGARVEDFIKWPDHFYPSAHDMAGIRARARRLDLEDLVTTAKDAVKLPPDFVAGGEGKPETEGPRIWVLEVEMEMLGGHEELTRLLVGP